MKLESGVKWMSSKTYTVSKMVDVTETMEEAVSRENNESNDDWNHGETCHITVASSQEGEGKYLELQHKDSDVEEHDGCWMDPVIDFTWSVNIVDVILVHKMLQSHI